MIPISVYKKRTCVIYVLFLFVAINKIVAQEPLFKKYTQENGLPSLITYSMAQDKKGFLWLCTSNGVCRFDGRHIKKFTPQNSLVDYGAYRLFLDSKNRLWVISIFSPPVYYSNDTFHSLDCPGSSLIAGTKALAEDSKGNIFFFTKTGTIIEYNNSTCILRLSLKAGLFGGVVINDSVILTTDGNVLWRIINLKKIEIVPIERYTNGEILKLYKVSNNSVIVSAKKGLYRVTNKENKLIWQWPDGVVSDCYTLHCEDDSTYWIGTHTGVYILQYKNDQLVVSRKLLQNKYISCIQKDNYNNYWIASWNDAIYFLNTANTVYYNLPEPKNNILKILFIKDTGYIFNSGNDYFILKNNNLIRKGNLYTADKNLIHIKSVMFSENAIFIQFKNAVGILNRQGFRLKRDGREGALSNYYYRRDETFFVGGCLDNGNALITSRKNGHEEQIMSLPSCIFSKNFCVDMHNCCWAGYNDTLYAAWYDKKHQLRIDKYFEKNVFISDIQCDDSNKIWIATKGGGVYCIKNRKKVAFYNTGNGLLTNNCSSIYIDLENNIWVCTENGLNEILQNENTPHNIRTFTKDNFLPDNGVNTVFRKGNIVYVGTCKGLVSFKNDEINATTTFPTPCYITNVSIKGRDTALQNSYTIKYGHSISFGFSTIAFNNSRPPIYYYRLSADADWNTTIAEKIQFEHLSPGKYTFSVYANSWPSNGANVVIIVLAPFWAKWWFICLEVFVSIFFLSVIFYLVLYLKNRKTDLKRRMIENDLRSLRAQINPHFIFNALNSIQDFILKQEPRHANYYLSQFARLIRMIVDNSKKEYINLSDEIEFLSLYLELEKLRLGDSFSFNIHFDPILNPQDISIPAMIIQPIVENAIVHGLFARKGEKILEINFQQQDGLLLCIVTDNGVGRVYARQHEHKKNKTSMGIENITERLQLICRKENIKWHAIEIIDTYNNNTATGTKVSLFIPFNLN